MNRALQSTPRRTNDENCFSVQSENNIWWLGSFEVCNLSPLKWHMHKYALQLYLLFVSLQVDKEDHELLKWAFDHTEIPTIIDRQTKGEKLIVDGIGDFVVEWHLAGDLKTLKCMYNVSKGANSKTPCYIIWIRLGYWVQNSRIENRHKLIKILTSTQFWTFL